MISIKTRKKQAQIKIQETAFMLLALVLLFSIAFLFYYRVQYSSLLKKAEDKKTEQALSLLDMVAAMPELRCSASLGTTGESVCIDTDKVIAFEKFKSEYKNMWRGLAAVKIAKIYPKADNETEKTEYSLYEKSQGNLTYSTFINLCKTEFKGVGWYKCDIGMIMVSI